jgi:hypothetical protein
VDVAVGCFGIGFNPLRTVVDLGGGQSFVWPIGSNFKTFECKCLSEI